MNATSMTTSSTGAREPDVGIRQAEEFAHKHPGLVKFARIGWVARGSSTHSPAPAPDREPVAGTPRPLAAGARPARPEPLPASHRTRSVPCCSWSWPSVC